MEEITTTEVKEAVENVIGEDAARTLGESVKSVLEFLEHPLIRGAVTIVLCLIVAKVLLTIGDKAMKRAKVDVTPLKFIRSLSRIVVYTAVILIVAGTLGFNVTSLVALFSVVGAAFALAAQNILSDFFGGVLLLMSKPLLSGEYVVIGQAEGTVQEVSLLHTRLITLDNRMVVVPNSSIASDVVINCSRGGVRRVDLNFSISYSADMNGVKKVLLNTMEVHPLVLSQPEPPFARITALGESAVVYTARFWCKGSDYWPVQYDLLEQIKTNLDQAGIEITYNHLNVHLSQTK